MRIRTILPPPPLAAGAVAALALVVAAGCALDDLSDQVFVTIAATSTTVVRGDKVFVQAKAFRLDGVDTVEVKNIQFHWISGNPGVATVAGDEFGGAEITGVNAGLVDISAIATAYQDAATGDLVVRVSDALEIDSVRPSLVQWGEKVRVYGVGVRNIFIADLGATLFPDTLTFQGDPLGLGVMEFWVPPPARTNRLFALGPGVFLNAQETTQVDTVDLYEYNDTIPSLISLDGPGPYPTQIPTLLYFNPALAFEEPPRDTLGTGVNSTRFDWYRFNRADPSRPLTLVLTPQGVADSTGLFIVLSDSIAWFPGHVPGAPSWFVTTEGGNHCGSPPFTLFPDQARSDSVVLALRRLPRYSTSHTGIHLLAFYQQPQRYAITIVDGYLTADPRIGPDRFEENDICSFADTNFADPTKRIAVTSGLFGTGFADSLLTIDNPHEMDWYKFNVTAPLLTDSTMIKVRSRPFPGTIFDRSDVDLYVVRASPFQVMGFVSSAGSRDSMRLLLSSGDYYLGVFDFRGEATRYALCIRVTFNCTPPTPLAEAAATDAAVAAAARRPERGRDDGRTKTGWALTRSPTAPAAGRSPFQKP
jgi:hypothetical protein